MTEGGINRAVSRDQLFPHVGRDHLHLLRQRQPAALAEQRPRRLVEAMCLHDVRERRLDQRIAVNQRAIEVEDQAARMAIWGWKKRLWFGCHV